METSLLDDLKKCYNDPYYSDYAFAFGAQEIFCHRAILSQCDIIKQELDNNPKFNLFDLDFYQASQFLYYLYTCSYLELNIKQLIDLIVTLDKCNCDTRDTANKLVSMIQNSELTKEEKLLIEEIKDVDPFKTIAHKLGLVE